MKITNFRRREPKVVLRGSLACALTVVATAAAGTEFEPTLSVGLIRTDNLTLVAVDPESATILQVSPEFAVSQESPRVNANAAYRMDAYYYDERGEHEVFNVFDGEVLLSVVPKKFFFDLGAMRTQAIIDPESTIPLDNLVISGNRVDRDDYYAGPSFEFSAGGDAVVTGDLLRTWVRYAEDDSLVGSLDDYEADEGRLRIDNYRKGAGFAWAARYDYEATDYGEAFVPYEHRQASVELGFWATDAMRLFAIGGKESPWDTPLETGLKDSFWEAGFAQQLGEDFHAEFAVGERSFGSSRRGELDYDFGRGSTTFSYSESPTTTSYDSYDPGLLNPDDPNDYLFHAGSNERYISNLLEWSFNLQLQRISLQLRLLDESREERTQADGTPLADERQSGGSLSVSWQLGSRTDLYLRSQRVDREFATGDTSFISADVIGTSYRLGRRTVLAFELEQREETSEDSGTLDYRANLASLILSRTFSPK